jgi:hypothetical protein
VAYSAGSESSYQIEMVRKVRRLPLPGEVLVKEGDAVGPDDVTAKISLRPGIPWVVPASRLLGIEAEELPRAMKRKIGDRVKTKEVIAQAEQGLYGRKEYESPTDGIIEDISGRSGRVVIREEFGKEEPPISIDAAVELGVRPRELERFMIKHVGEEVKRGQIVAKKGEQAAFFTKSAYAPISGIISEVNTQTGYVTISRPFKEVVVKAYITGTVVEVLPGRGVVVAVPGVQINGIFGVGRETHGRLKMLVDSPSATVGPELITEECRDHILVGGGFVTNEALSRAMTVGARGFITGTATYLHVVNSLGVKLGVGITGQEDIPMTLILMEGFGHLAMRERVFRALQALEGREASINGATQIRAGAIRPEIIVPFPDHEREAAARVPVDEDLSLGQKIRVISEPCFGEIGQVLSLPREALKIETEATVPVVRILLESGTEVTVPRANVEVF